MYIYITPTTTTTWIAGLLLSQLRASDNANAFSVCHCTTPHLVGYRRLCTPSCANSPSSHICCKCYIPVIKVIELSNISLHWGLPEFLPSTLINICIAVESYPSKFSTLSTSEFHESRDSLSLSPSLGPVVASCLVRPKAPTGKKNIIATTISSSSTQPTTPHKRIPIPVSLYIIVSDLVSPVLSPPTLHHGYQPPNVSCVPLFSIFVVFVLVFGFMKAKARVEQPASSISISFVMSCPALVPCCALAKKERQRNCYG